MARETTTDDRGTAQRDDMTAIQKSKSAELSVAYDEARASKEIEAAVIVAHRYPRDKMAAYGEIIVACDRFQFADRAYYEFPRGGKPISGPSVVLARMMAAEWGNIRYGGDVVRDDDNSRKVRGWAWDLQRNVLVSAEDEFKKLIQRKVHKGRPDETTEWIEPDERDMRELTNRRIALLVRNCLLQIIPADFTDDALARCFDTIKNGVVDDKSRAAVLKRLVVAFKKIGVTTATIERYFGTAINDLKPADVASLGGMYRGIIEGNSTISEIFGGAATGTGPESGKVDIKGFKVVDEKEKADGKAEPKKASARRPGRPKGAKKATTDTNGDPPQASGAATGQDAGNGKLGGNGDDAQADPGPPNLELTEAAAASPDSKTPAGGKHMVNAVFNDRLDEIMELGIKIGPEHVDELCLEIGYPRIDDPAGVDILTGRGAYKSAIGALRGWAIDSGFRMDGE